MASYDFTNGSISGQMVPRKQCAEENEPFLRRNIVDFSKQNLAAGDDAKVLDIESGVAVKTAFARVITADSGGGTVTLGKTSSGTQWGSAATPDTAGGVLGGTVSVQYYSSDGGIYMLGATATLTTAKVEVIAECVKCVDAI